MRSNRRKDYTRAFPRSDEPRKVNNPSIKKVKAKIKIRIGTWNIGSLTGRSKELAEILKRRNIDICCIQELKWKGAKARKIGESYTVLYNGFNAKNGIGIVFKENMCDKIIEVKRISDRLMYVKMVIENKIYNIMSAYAPQTGCDSQTKLLFFESLEETMQAISLNEAIILCGDLNGHIGRANGTNSPCHGGFGYGQINEQGEWILDIASAYDLKI
ncbi:craniofacial development protein 2-like [Condylostylus longicornis]|uniref:craniofacial development protein 2-like n=1 Tax=Condylostylus longicornis TaxID=2530218 RepID=UPI00244DBD3E|nr:craniofacial development protein 2-like [Condylostylus longicornis]